MVRMSPVSRSVIKVAMVGEGGVGKTTIASRLVTGTFVEHMMTVGFDVETWSILNESVGETVRVAIFDIAGQPQFRFFQPSLVIGTEAVLIVVDVTSPESLYKINEWLSMIQHVPRDRWIMVANKIDMEHAVPDEELKNVAQFLGVPVYPVSAKTGEGFDRLIQALSNVVFTATQG